jgi:predicted anti-sigma-YlaC factor YlaD
VREFRERICDRTREAVSLSLDGNPSAFERHLVAAHLARCESCRKFERDARSTTALLRAAPLEMLDHSIVLPQRRRFRPVVGSTAAAAAACVAVMVGALLGASEAQRDTRLGLSGPPRAELLRDDRFFRPTVGQTRTFDFTGGSSNQVAI